MDHGTSTTQINLRIVYVTNLRILVCIVLARHFFKCNGIQGTSGAQIIRDATTTEFHSSTSRVPLVID